MRKNNQEDNLLKEVLNQKANGIEVGDGLLNQIKVNIYEREGEISMKNKRFSFKNKKRALVMMMGCIALISTTVIAGAFGKGWTSYTTVKYPTFPSVEAVQKDIGFVPKYVESFSNGFEFKVGGIGENQLIDDANNTVIETKSITLGYEQESTGKQINMNAEQMEEKYMVHGSDEKMQETYKGYPLYYYEKTYKFVPEDYELTEEDQKAYDAGEMEISFGSSEVSVEQIQSISWYEEGVRYSIGGNDLNLPVEELLDMAKTIIDAK